jgi:hypothetical protein
MMMTATFSAKASTVLYPAFSVEQEGGKSKERIVGREGVGRLFPVASGEADDDLTLATFFDIHVVIRVS